MKNQRTLPYYVKTLFRLLFVTSILGSAICARANGLKSPSNIQNPAITSAEICLEIKLAGAKSLYEHGVGSYSEMLAAEAELLQVRLASGAKSDEIRKRLQEIYSEQIKIAQTWGNREGELEFQIKLLEISADRHEDLLNFYRQLIDYRLNEYNHGVVSYNGVLEAKIGYLKAILHDQSSEQAEEIEDKLVSGIGEIRKQLQEVYRVRIKLAQEAKDRESELGFQIKLLEISTDSREDLLNCYRQIIDFRLDMFNHGMYSYIAVLEAEISYLKAAMHGQSAEQVKKIEEEILQKQGALKQLLDASPWMSRTGQRSSESKPDA